MNDEAVDPDDPTEASEGTTNGSDGPDEADTTNAATANDSEGGDATDRSAVGDEPTDSGDVAVPDDLLERVADASDERLAREIAALRERIADLESTVDAREEAIEAEREEAEDLQSRLKQKQADFQNFKKRMERRREEERERATEDLVTRLLDIRDNLKRALAQDADADIRGGVESTLEEFDRVLGDENVSEIAPEPGEEVDPQRHEVMMRVDSEHPPETIAEVFRSGYEMGGKVLRPAQVTVSDGE